jgi:hypothetical protein
MPRGYNDTLGKRQNRKAFAMRHHKPHLLKNLVGCIAAAGCLLIVAASATLAQSGPPAGVGPPGNNNPNLESRDREVREGALRSAEMDAAVGKRNQQRVEAVVVQVKEDFAHLQIVRNEIARNLVARKPLDYHLISDQTAEINKRANRLKIYMMPRAPEDKEKEQKNLADQHPTRAARVGTPQLNGADMTGALVKLCKLVDSFVENPALKNEVNAQQLDKVKADKARADSDLLGIVELSESIQKGAESLKKTPQ